MSAMLVLATLVLFLQITVHFWRKEKLSGRAKNLYNHAMMAGNAIVLFALLSSYLKTKRVVFMIPVVAYAIAYFVNGHNNDRDTGEVWTLVGGLTLGVLSSGLNL